MIGGGLFLLAKATFEIHGWLEGGEHGPKTASRGGFLIVLGQIALLDAVFSIDSVITAIGLADQVVIMVIAIVTAVAVMLISAKPIGDFRRAASDSE